MRNNQQNGNWHLSVSKQKRNGFYFIFSDIQNENDISWQMMYDTGDLPLATGCEIMLMVWEGNA